MGWWPRVGAFPTLGISPTSNLSDWLGTERIRTNLAGTTCEMVTSLPFGDAQATSVTLAETTFSSPRDRTLLISRVAHPFH